jgi:hypothetical protein
MKNFAHAKPLLLILALLAALALACSMSGGEPAASEPDAPDFSATQASLEATQEALAAEVEEAEQAEEVEEEPTDVPPTSEPTRSRFFTEEFEGGLGDWSYFVMNGPEDGFEVYNEGGNLVFDIEEENVYAYLSYDPETYDNVRIDARVRNLGSNNNNVTLYCRESERGWYEFNVANNGLYWIFLYDANDDQYELLYNGGSTAIKTGKDVNEYTAICDGEELTLLINGVEARSVENSTLQEGFVGVSVSSFDFVPVLVHFEWVTVSQP